MGKYRIIRKLNPIEQAFTLSNDAMPLCVVCVLQLCDGPDAMELEAALAGLQSRHALLKAGIHKAGGQYYFHQLAPLSPIPLNLAEQKGPDAWQAVAEGALNTIFDRRGPLMKCWYLTGVNERDCELIVCFHHAIIDGISARLILHELLSLAGGIELPPPVPGGAVPVFPGAFRGLRWIGQILRFAGRQMRAEWAYKKAGMIAPIPAGSENAVVSFRLSPEISRKLTVRIGREGLSLNTVLLAAITQVVAGRNYAGKKKRLARILSFADLRPSVVPAVSDQELGCYVSMLRLSVPVAEETTLSELSSQVRKAIYKASRQGEVFILSKISKQLVGMVLRLKNQRLGVSALSFIGKLDLDQQYGPIGLKHVSAFITNNRFGPEFSAFGKILFGAISLDFTYLTAETGPDLAQEMAEEIRAALENMADSPYI
ncbi:MAG TPA: hypothetical protein PKB07_18120 [Flavilitoribacter sp.]|nr:hypothetical protein [Flavilitoribacter sp.]